ncbi:hypothetical protein [Pseudomonas sp. CFBP 13719]|uniref:hypothetical protein n=1 Tax=Pseudomonas sp. CFBP 13719 TaxID=2775303 RepID=UPI00178676CB|nr:hypothetical protein [Pseudomonas sp. CFBP 13719]MBD8682322.1 hypothetical protein [Pseudomonas sp. CFBP 13719]
MLIKKGEVLTIASGIYEGYDRSGPFVATQDFDLATFVASAKATIEEPWEVAGLMYEIPRMLYAQGLLAKQPCRRIYFEGMMDFELGEEKDDFP